MNTMTQYTIKSANDLTLMIYDLRKKYKIDKFLEDYIEIFDTLGLNRDKLKEYINNGDSRGFNPSSLSDIEKLVEHMELSLSEEQITVFINNVQSILKKYKYYDFLNDCSIARKIFLEERKNYFRSTIVITNARKKKIENVLDGLEDSLLATWIDNTLKKYYPSNVEMKYEDVNGEIHEIKTVYRSTDINTDYIETSLIDRYTGICPFDSFMLHGFYDLLKKRWVYVPIKLIISIKSDQIDELSENEDDDKESK